MHPDQITNLPCERTRFGFKWGVATISRACEHRGNIVLTIETPKQRVMVRVTPKGFIRLDPIEANRGEKYSVAI